MNPAEYVENAENVENVWLYAVVLRGHPMADGATGVADEPLYAVEGSGIAAAAGKVPRADFDEEPLRRHLEDPDWLERTVRAHHEAVGAIARGGPLLPTRFATIYGDDRRVAAMLRERHGELSAALARIVGRAEWGVKAYVAGSAGAPAGDDGGSAGPERPGTAYLFRRKALRERRDEALRRATDEAQQVHAALAAVAAASTRHPLRSVETSGSAEPMVLNGAYLVQDDRLPALEAVVEAVAVDHPGLRVEVTGPWPPYSFSGADGGGT